MTYESIPKLERSALHRRAADWLGGHAERPDLSVPIARHLAQAVSLRREVAPLEPVEPELVRSAVEALRTAASWSSANASVHQAAELLRSAVDIAGDDDEPAQLASAQLAAVLARSGAADEAVERAERVLAGSATPEATALASLALAEAARARGDADGMIEAGNRALELAEPLALRDVEVEAHDIVGLAYSWSGRRLSLAVEHRRRATEIARELGDLPRVAWSMAGHPAIALMQMGRIDEAERQVDEALRLATETGSLRALEASHAVLSVLRRAQDRLEDAAEHGRERVTLAERLGETMWLFNALTVNLARALVDLGRLDDAWTAIDRALKVSGASSVPDDLAHAMRAEILVRRGRLDEADAEAALTGWPDSYEELAELRAAQGRIGEAEEIWQRVLAEYAGGEARLERAEAVVAYARFLAAQGQRDGATARLSEARALVAGAGAKLVERLIREAEAAL